MAITRYAIATRQDTQDASRARARSNSLVAMIDSNKQDNNNNYYYNIVRARNNSDNTIFDVLDAAYYDIFGRNMPRCVWTYLCDCMDAGADAEMLAAIIEYTGGAPRPSWAYARAVIERQMAAGARTAQDFRHGVEAYRARYAVKGGAPVRDPAADYQQREYAAGSFDGLSDAQIAEVAK